MRKYRFKFDEYEIGLLLNCLIQMRNKQLEAGAVTDKIDELIIKLGK